MDDIQLNPDAEITDEQMYPSGFTWRPKIVKTLDYEGLKEKYNFTGTHLTLLSGVSTAGKDTLLKKALEKIKDVTVVPRATSRPPRPGEIDGIDYFSDSTDFLLWSRYAGHTYAVPSDLFEILATKKNVIMANGLVYLPTLKDIFERLGTKVTIVNIVPGKLTDSLENLQQTILDRLAIRNEKDQRITNALNELKSIFQYKDYLQKLELIFIENTPHPLGYSPEAVEKLEKILIQK